MGVNTPFLHRLWTQAGVKSRMDVSQGSCVLETILIYLRRFGVLGSGGGEVLPVVAGHLFETTSLVDLKL